jgi:glycosidase
MSAVDLFARMGEILATLYPGEDVEKLLDNMKEVMDRYKENEVILEKRRKYDDHISLNEDDAILITYADSIRRKGEKPLRTLRRFMNSFLKDTITGVHILPFYPSTSDMGYSVVSYTEVAPNLGMWEDIRGFGREYRLMADLVLNHVSSQSKWFKGFVRGEAPYLDYFLSFDKPVDMPEVFRPRMHPLLTEFDTAAGKRYVWTTFSEDQIDLNFHNPEVTRKILDVLMFYLSQGIEMIRLDAIGYVWKEPGTSCVNLPQTHDMVKLLRTVVEYAAPYAVIVAEVNFPYRDNVSYLEARHEANMGYHFSLPPLVMDGFANKDTSYLQEDTHRIRQDLVFFNFLASHDGMGLLSAREILPASRFDGLLRTTVQHGGLISYKATAQGKTPYELNIAFYDAINDPSHPDQKTDVKRFLSANAIMLVDKGIPGIYIHCLLGSRNYLEGPEKTGMNRMINREKLSQEEVFKELSNPDSRRFQVLEGFVHLLKARRQIKAFHHAAAREVVRSDERLFVMARQGAGESVDAVINVSDHTVDLPQYVGRYDFLSKSSFVGRVEPYGVHFLK